jgi:hypothetical protein
VCRCTRSAAGDSGRYRRRRPRPGTTAPAIPFLAWPAAEASDALPLHYRLLAAQLYTDGEITETQFARFLRTDIVGARRACAELTETADVASDGSPQILDLAAAAG